MQKDLLVHKRNGSFENLDVGKIHKVIHWAVNGIEDVSESLIEINSRIQFFDKISTEEIHDTLIKASADLISESSPNYQYVASRLALFQLRKKAYGKFEPPSLYEHVKKQVSIDNYDLSLLESYTKEEFFILDSYIEHQKDLNFSYVAIKQLEGKYLIKDRVTNQIYETPQFLYILIAACLFKDYNQDTRLSYVRRFYEAISNFIISLPTPIMAGVRTKSRQFSSCVLIECDDSLDSINSSSNAIIKYVSQRAGIGINAGRIRALGAKIRGGETYHTGCIPFYKLFQSAVKSCSQGGIRGGAATLFYPIWHHEVESLLVLKNNKGTEDNRVRHLDYGVQLSRLFYQRLIDNQKITLFSPEEVPDLYEAFFKDNDEFESLYLGYEENLKIRRKTINANDLFSSLMQERANTGRIYIQNVDHCNSHSSFDPRQAPIRQSNLCLEITLPTKPLNDNLDQGEIALCTLSAINLGKIKDLSELENLCDLSVRALDSLLDYQTYPHLKAKNSTLHRRSLGIGVINFAYYLAKNNVKYSDFSANKLVHQTFEAFQYYLLKASNNLAREFGPCELFNETKYAKGILPIDTYKKTIDSFANFDLELDWNELRANIQSYGLRNSTLSSLMPSETSSQITNSTNGIEPPRGLVSVKVSKNGVLRQVVPEVSHLKNNYELLWQIKSNDGYLQLVAIAQKFIDQSISTNLNYDPSNYQDHKIPLTVMLKDLLKAYSYGVKTLYYHNTRDNTNEEIETESQECESGACKI